MLMDHTPKFLPNPKGIGKWMYDWKGGFFVSDEFPKDLWLPTEWTNLFGNEAIKMLEKELSGNW